MPSDASDALDVALRVAAVLDSLGVEYFVGGSVASSLQGEPRATNDIDMVVAMPPGYVPAFARSLGPDFEVDEDMLRDALHRSSCANIFFLPTVTKVDIVDPLSAGGQRAVGLSSYDSPAGRRRVGRGSCSRCPSAVGGGHPCALHERSAPAPTGDSSASRPQPSCRRFRSG